MNDIIAAGLENGWQVTHGSKLTDDTTLETDVVIIGSGAGGATSAEILSNQGLKVIVVEEGKLHHQKHFKLDELDSFSSLYQDAAARLTADGGIAVLQGKTVGGTTVINWTSSFRTPEQTLKHWGERHAVEGVAPVDMQSWFIDREKRLNMTPWIAPPNGNNTVLKQGCDALGWSSDTIMRNVKGCWNIGYCGFGCPTNAKQSMLVTSIPAALDKGAHLLTEARAHRLHFKGGRVDHLECYALDDAASIRTGRKIRINARHFICAAGAIGSPGIMLRSDTPDPYKRLGKRTFLHPVNATVAMMPEPVRGFEGAPQSVYSDEFLWRDGVTGEAGFKLEVAPVFPGGMSGNESLYGKASAEMMSNLDKVNLTVALQRDGFNEESQGGEVKLRDDGSPVLDYPLNDYLWRGVRRAFSAMAEVQFAAGAKSVRPLHLGASKMLNWSEAKQMVNDLDLATTRTNLFSAHVMGGCSMGQNVRESVVDSLGQHHQIENLSVMDGSVFPTSIGANPQLSIYAIAAKWATHLGQQMTA